MSQFRQITDLTGLGGYWKMSKTLFETTSETLVYLRNVKLGCASKGFSVESIEQQTLGGLKWTFFS